MTSRAIEVQTKDLGNREQFARLLALCREILAVCSELDIRPVLSGSLAVFAYTQAAGMRVHDIDLACSEREFPRLSRALAARGIAHELREWRVLQVRQGDLKVEFDSMEQWMGGVPGEFDTLVVDGTLFRVVSLPALRELYRRGLEATAGNEAERAKHAAIAEKYWALCEV